MGLLQMGPQSAGSDPGPACYGQGGKLPTVSDANLVMGYLNPDGLVGDAIPLEARIVALTDVFDALTSARPYKAAWSVEQALEFIQQQAGAGVFQKVLDQYHEQGLLSAVVPPPS